MFEGFLNQSILKRAQTKGLAEICIHDLRNYSTDKHGNVDGYAFGGGAGMVMMAEPIVLCIEELGKERGYDEIIFMTPDGEQFDQPMANSLSLKKNIIMVCGRYKGIDQRVRDHWITKEISIGEYVLSGGELPAAVVADAIIRLIPGVLSDESSALLDSYQGELLDAPVYTRPEDFRGYKVPDVLLSGDHKKLTNGAMSSRSKRLRKERRSNVLMG